MKKWNITGVDRTTGQDVFRCVDANSSDEAVKLVLSEMVIEKIEESKGYRAPITTRPPKIPRVEVPYREGMLLRVLLLCLAVLSLAIAVLGLIITIYYIFLATGAGLDARSAGVEAGKAMVASGVSGAFMFWAASVVVGILRSIALNTTPNQPTRP